MEKTFMIRQILVINNWTVQNEYEDRDSASNWWVDIIPKTLPP